jgi:hypothetical protein
MQPAKKIVVPRSVVPLPLKLAGMFALAFAFFFVVLFGYDLLSGFIRSSAANAEVSQAKTSVAVDPKIALDLEKVLTTDPDTDTADVKDPFIDRAGLSGAVAASGATLPGQVVAGQRLPVVNAAGVTTGVMANGAVSSGRSGSGAAQPAVVSAVDATRARYNAWVSSGAAGTLDPRIFSVEDLLPVGIVDGGTGGQEVMFFSEAVGKTVSFPVGTLFYDGWLSELRTEGVVFSSNDERHTSRMRAWAHSIKSEG